MGKVALTRASDGDVEQAGRPWRQARQIPGHLGRELPLPDRQGRRAAEQRWRRLRQAVEAQRLALIAAAQATALPP